jgi:hypothetical protein
MQPKIIKIPFNYDNFIECQKTVWSFSLKKVIKNYLIYTILPLVVLIVDFASDKVDNVGIIIGSGLLVYVILKWIDLFERRKKFFKRAKNYSARLEQDAKDCTFSFNESAIEYQDKEKSYRLNWSLFNPYLTYKNTILLTEIDTKGIIFSISKSEVGDENYQELCTILADKIGFDKAIK